MGAAFVDKKRKGSFRDPSRRSPTGDVRIMLYSQGVPRTVGQSGPGMVVPQRRAGATRKWRIQERLAGRCFHTFFALMAARISSSEVPAKRVGIPNFWVHPRASQRFAVGAVDFTMTVKLGNTGLRHVVDRSPQAVNVELDQHDLELPARAEVRPLSHK